MLIVIVIIGILVAAFVPRLQSVQARARDAKRKVDLRSINTAVEIHRVDNGTYPQDKGKCGIVFFIMPIYRQDIYKYKLKKQTRVCF